MSESRRSVPTNAGYTKTPDNGVTLRIPRRVPVIGLVMVALFAINSILGLVVYRALDQADAPADPAPDHAALPPPVTFIPPTPESDELTGRFEVSPDDDPAIGPVDAPVVMIEFSDYQCQYCGTFAREILHPLLELYKGQIRFVYRDFVIYGPASLQAAVAAECAADQGAFWPYHDRLFEQQNHLNREFFMAMAEELSLDLPQFERCISDPAVEDEVNADTAAGQALGIRGTPTFYINGRVIVGAQPLEAYAAIIDEELALAAPGASTNAPQDRPHES